MTRNQIGVLLAMIATLALYVLMAVVDNEARNDKFYKCMAERGNSQACYDSVILKK